MVALAVAAILVAIAVPSYRAIVTRNAVAASVNEYIGALHLARSEAVTRGVDVAVCKSADAASCTGSGGWEQGWIVFDDSQGNFTSASYTPTNAEVLRVGNGLKQATVRGNANVDDSISFNPNGFAFGSAGTIRVCGKDGDSRTDIVIAPSGRVRSTENNGGKCP